jgi:hypothetical protein
MQGVGMEVDQVKLVFLLQHFFELHDVVCHLIRAIA